MELTILVFGYIVLPSVCAEMLAIRGPCGVRQTHKHPIPHDWCLLTWIMIFMYREFVNLYNLLRDGWTASWAIAYGAIFIKHGALAQLIQDADIPDTVPPIFIFLIN